MENKVLYFFKGDLLEGDITSSSVIISSVLKLMPLLGLERNRIERELIFRSNLLLSLGGYLETTYRPFLASTIGAPPVMILERIREDAAIFEIFLLVLNRRLTVIDDLEFQGTQHSGTQFLSHSQTAFIADLLNRGFAYRAFQSP
jgi:hypothetical protein